MEDTLREAGAKSVKNLKVSLNPCSNGRYSQRALVLLLMLVLRLNPCSNGRYSQSIAKTTTCFSVMVLILVLMEDTLREYCLS